MKHLVLCVLTVFLLSACSVLSPVRSQPNTVYMLDTLPKPMARPAARAAVLTVARPETSVIYDTTQIAYRVRPHQISYFTRHSWVAKPADMLQELFIQNLTRAAVFQAVTTRVGLAQNTIVLNTQLQEIQQDLTHQPATFSLTMRAQLVRAADNKIMASRVFTVKEIMSNVTPEQGIVAANRAAAQMVQYITLFCINAALA